MPPENSDSPRPMSLWTVYYRPTDWPHGYIARRFEILPDEARATKDTLTAEMLDELRHKLPLGLVCTARHPDDDANIVEVWL